MKCYRRVTWKRAWGAVQARYDCVVTTAEAPSPRASVLLRFVGVGVDWVLSLVISAAFFPDPAYGPDATAVERVLLAGHPMATLGIFAAQHVLLVATLGTTIGHRLVGVRVVREDGAPYVGLLRAVARTILLLLVIPAVVWEEVGRGFHDRGAGTQIVSTRKA